MIDSASPGGRDCGEPLAGEPVPDGARRTHGDPRGLRCGRRTAAPLPGADVWRRDQSRQPGHRAPPSSGAAPSDADTARCVLLVAGVVAAALSSATTFLSACRLQCQPRHRAADAVDDRTRLRVSRLSMLGFGSRHCRSHARLSRLRTRFSITFFRRVCAARVLVGSGRLMSVWTAHYSHGVFWA